MEPKPHSRVIYEFDNFRLDRGELMVYRDGVEVSLPPKAVETVVALVERSGQIVTKDELMEAIWSDTAVEESNLSRYIHLLRSALGKQADGRPYIETFRRRGYRFSGNVRRVEHRPSDAPAAIGTPPGPNPAIGNLHVAKAVALKPNVVSLADWQKEPHSETPPSAAVDAEPPVNARSRQQKIGLGVLISVVVAGLAIAIAYGIISRGTVLTDQDVILVADFDNRTGEEIFDDALKQGLEIQLKQSPFLSIFPDESTRETLKLMQRQPDERITREVAREICRRRGVKAFIAGTIVSVGTNYVLTLKAINAESDEILASEMQEAAGPEQVISSLSRAATGLREKLGESLQSIAKLDSPLELTTTSLEAVKLHSMALKAGRRQDYQQAIALFRRAIEIDPGFAFAYIDLSIAYENAGHGELRAAPVMKAYELRDRVSELERLLITDSYHGFITADLDQRREALLIAHQLYPRDYRVLYRLSSLYEFTGEFEKAIHTAREALENRASQRTYIILARSYISLNRPADARAALDESGRSEIRPAVLYTLEAEVGFVTGDQDLVDRSIGSLIERGEEEYAFAVQGRMAVRRGQFGQAREFYRKAMEVTQRKKLILRTGAFQGEFAVYSSMIDRCAEASDGARKALEIYKDMLASSRAELTFAICGQRKSAESLVMERVRRNPTATLLNTVQVPLIRAILENREGKPAAAIEALQGIPEGITRSNFQYKVQFTRGQAYLKLRQGAEAAREFQSIIDTPGEESFSPLYPLAYLGLGRAFLQTGDVVKAREAYDKFFEIWKHADPDIPQIVEARREYQQIFQ